MNGNSHWPDLPLAAWSDTCDTLHLWTQIAGKVRLKLTPLINHWWNVTFRVSSRGLVASGNCYGGRMFDIVFDLFDHQLLIATDDGSIESFALAPMSVADFHAAFMQRLSRLGIDVSIWTMPSEIEGAVPFEQDFKHAHYDPEYAARFLLRHARLPISTRPIGPRSARSGSRLQSCRARSRLSDRYRLPKTASIVPTTPTPCAGSPRSSSRRIAC